MSAHVDVPAVLGRIAYTNEGFAEIAKAEDGYIVRVAQSMLEKQAADLIEARAAVAELIAAVGDSDSSLTDPDAIWFSRDKAVRLRAALARVGGAS